MTDLSEIIALHAEQDAGAFLDIIHPVTGEPTGLRFRIAGPDSNVQRRARDWARHWYKAGVMVVNGRPIAGDEMQTEVGIGLLARCIVGWDIRENGLPVPFDIPTAVRILRASPFIRTQIDEFAASRAHWRKSPRNEGGDHVAD